MDGRKFRVLVVIYKWHRRGIALQVDHSLMGQSLVDALNEITLDGPLPLVITVDHGTDFTSKALDEWCYLRGVKIEVIRPGKLTENGMIESFNRRLRDECLNVNEFVTVDDMKTVLGASRRRIENYFVAERLGNAPPKLKSTMRAVRVDG